MLKAIQADDGRAVTDALFEAGAGSRRPGGPPSTTRVVTVSSARTARAVGRDGVFDEFSDRAMVRYAEWLGVQQREPAADYPANGVELDGDLRRSHRGEDGRR